MNARIYSFIFQMAVRKHFFTGQIANLPGIELVSGTQFGQINNLSYNFGQTLFRVCPKRPPVCHGEERFLRQKLRTGFATKQSLN